MNKKGDGLIVGGAITNIALVSINMLLGLIVFIPVLILGTTFAEISGGGMEHEVIVGFDKLFMTIFLVSMIISYILSILTIVFSVKAMKNPKFKIVAGVFGILTNLIGGILILCGKYKDQETQTQTNSLI